MVHFMNIYAIDCIQRSKEKSCWKWLGLLDIKNLFIRWAEVTSQIFMKILSVTWPCGIPSGREKPNWRFFALLRDGWNTEKYADIDWWVQKANLWETEISGEDASLKEFSTWQKSVLDKNLFAHVALWLGYIVIKYSL